MADNAIPSPRDDDDEDVHWALSTAVTLWGRGERAEALKWLKRAAEQASDADKDIRSLELFKAAADLQPLVAAGAAAQPAVPAPAPSVAPPAHAPAAAPSRMPPPPLPTNRPPPPGVRPPQPSLPPATQASPALTPAPASAAPMRSAPPPAPRASVRPAAPPPGQTPPPASVAPPPRVPSMPGAPPAAASARATTPATPAPPPVSMPTRKRLPSRTGARKSVAGDPLARTGKNPVAPAGAPQGGATKAAGGSGKRPKTTIIDQGWGDFTPTPAPLPVVPPPPDEEITAARNRAALMDMPIDDLEGVTNIFTGRDIARQVAAVRNAAPGSQQTPVPSPVTITGMPAPSAAQHAPAPSATPHAPAPAPAVAHPPAAQPTHTPAPASVQPQMSRNKVGPASVRPAALPVGISHHAPAAPAQQAHAPAPQAHAPAPQAHAPVAPPPPPPPPAHTPAPSQVHTPQPVASQPAVHPPAAAPAAARVATVSAIRVAIFGREGDMRVLALAPNSSAPAGTVTALLVPTSDAEAAALAKLFGV